MPSPVTEPSRLPPVDDRYTVDLAVLTAVRVLNLAGARKLTFGQIYTRLIRSQTRVPTITECVVAVDVLVKEGLLVSERVLDEDPAFPYTQHIISGLTEIGAALLI
jgi:hypothetical protein